MADTFTAPTRAEQIRYSFNSGYHDGASDARNGRAKRITGTHLFALPEWNKPYRDAYDLGFADQQDGRYDEDSSAAWAAWGAKMGRRYAPR